MGILKRPKVEEIPESWILLHMLDVADDLADVVFKGWRLPLVCED
jgi:hypothetical protein